MDYEDWALYSVLCSFYCVHWVLGTAFYHLLLQINLVVVVVKNTYPLSFCFAFTHQIGYLQMASRYQLLLDGSRCLNKDEKVGAKLMR